MSSPRRDPHLGELASAFADDALDLPTRDRALVHLAHCDECRAEVDGQRQVKARLAKLTPPACPSSLLDRLHALPEVTGTERTAASLTPPPIRMEASFRSTAAAPRRVVAAAGRSSAGSGRSRPAGPLSAGPAAGGSRPAVGRPALARPGLSRRSRLRRSLVITAAGGVAAFALSLSTVVVLGGDQQPSTVTPPALTYLKKHQEVTGSVPGGDREAAVLDVADKHE